MYMYAYEKAQGAYRGFSTVSVAPPAVRIGEEVKSISDVERLRMFWRGLDTLVEDPPILSEVVSISEPTLASNPFLGSIPRLRRDLTSAINALISSKYARLKLLQYAWGTKLQGPWVKYNSNILSSY